MNGLGDGIGALFFALIGLAVISVPLAIWKLIDIGIWIFHHVSVVIQ